MEDQSLMMFVILETSAVPSKPKINAVYDSEEKAKRRFSEIADRKAKELADSFEGKEEGTSYRHIVVDVADIPSQVLISKNVVCEITKIIPAGYFTAEQTTVTVVPVLCLDLYQGCERVSLQKYDLALRQWREVEEELIWKVQSYATQSKWMEEQIVKMEQRALENTMERDRLELILDTLEASVAKLNSENARLTAENSKLQLENLGLYRSLQSPQQVGPFSAATASTQRTVPRQPSYLLVGPPYPEHFMAELRKKIVERK